MPTHSPVRVVTISHVVASSVEQRGHDALTTAGFLLQYKKPDIANGKREPSIVRFGPLLFGQMFNRLVALDNRGGKRDETPHTGS